MYRGYKCTVGIVTQIAKTLVTLKTDQVEELKRATNNLKLDN